MIARWSSEERTDETVKLEPNLFAAEASGGRIADNIVQFARLLRAAGLSVGPDRVILGTQAVLATGITSPGIVYAALHAVFVTKPDQHDIFDQAFYLFWKDPKYLEQMLSLVVPSLKGQGHAFDKELSRRLRETLLPQGAAPPQRPAEEVELDFSESWSSAAVSRTKDFAQMSAAEQHAARNAIARMGVAMAQIRTRRYIAQQRGARIDMRRVLADMGAKGPDYVVMHRQDRAWRMPPLVVLCDVSGSMDAYARMMLHFLHALTNARARVHSFLFGTHLWNITRRVHGKDPDAAVARVSKEVTDWSGGTRIGESLEEFNRLWARRVLGGNATVLLITDGLDREGGEGVARASRRLRASCRRLIWLNPLLRYDGYAAIATGARELRPNVSELRACHNLASLEALALALADAPGRGQPVAVRRPT
jgi:uncharacterized protein